MGPKSAEKKRKAELAALRKAEEERQEKYKQVVNRLRQCRKLDKQEVLRGKFELNLHNLRLITIEESLRFFDKLMYSYLNSQVKKRNREEWEQFMFCDGRPNVYQPPSLTMFLFRWDSKPHLSMQKELEIIEDYFILLEKLNRLLEVPLTAPDRKVQNWKDIRQGYRDEMLKKLDIGTYEIMRDIDKEMRRIDYWRVDYMCSSDNIQIGMFAFLPFPLSVTVKRDPPYMEFPNLGISIKLPIPFDKTVLISRIIHVSYDMLSDFCRSWSQPSRIEEGTLTQIIDYWLRRKLELARQRWQDEIKFLIAEKRRLTLTQHAKKKKKKAPPVVSESVDEGDVDVGVEEVVEEEVDYLEKWKRFNIIVKGMNVLELQEFFKPDIKEDVLDVFFNTESKEKQNIGHILMRKIVKEKPERDLRTSLLNLKVTDKLMNNLLDYFSEVPIAIEEAEEEEEEQMIEEQAPEEEEKPRGPSIYDETRGTVMLPMVREAMTLILDPHELNLRKSTILGGVYYYHMLKHVPQKQALKDNCFIQYHIGEYEIEKDYNFLFLYVPPPPFIPKTRRDVPPPDLNLLLLIQITLVLPDNFLWFELPVPVLWHYDENAWSRRYVHDVSFNKKENKLSFRMGKVLPFALSVNRFTNLPYQAWELRPGPAGSKTVQFTLIASPVVIEFAVRGSEVAMMSIKNIPNPYLRDFTKKFFKLNELIHLLRSRGLDLFPDDDTFLYVEVNSVKDYVIEEQVYMAMAIFAPYFQFSWSRWNMPAGWEKIVFLARQIHMRKTLPDYVLVLTDLFRSTILKCSEESEVFSEDSIPNIGFNADTYTLLRNICSPKVKKIVDNQDVELTNTVYNLLQRTKVFSFS